MQPTNTPRFQNFAPIAMVHGCATLARPARATRSPPGVSVYEA